MEVPTANGNRIISTADDPADRRPGRTIRRIVARPRQRLLLPRGRTAARRPTQRPLVQEVARVNERFVPIMATPGPGVAAWTRERWQDFGPPQSLLIISLIVGAFLRLWHLGSNPPGINQDEAVTGYDALSIWATGRDHHGNPFPFWVIETFGDWSSPLLTFLMAPFVGVFGLEIVVVRFVTVLLGLIMLVGVYGATRELTRSPWVAATATAFAAISPWAVHYSRYALLPITGMAFTMLAVWCQLWTMRTRSGPGLVASAALIGATALSYHTMKLYVPLIMVVFVILFRQPLLKIPRLSLLYGVLVGLFLAGPMLFMTLRDPAIGSRNNYLSITNLNDFGPRLLLENYWAYCSPAFLFSHGDGDATHTMPGYGMELRFIAPLLVIGLGFILWRLLRPGLFLPDRRMAALLLALIVLAPLPGALTQFPAANRSAVLSPLLAIVCGLAVLAIVFTVYRSLRMLSRSSRQLAVALLLIIGLVPAGIETAKRYDYYFTGYPHDYSVTWGFHHGLLDAIGVADSMADAYDVIWIADANQPYIFLLWSQQADPSTIQNRLVDTNDNPVVYDVNEWGKYRFGDNYQSPPDSVPLDELEVLYQSPHHGNEIFYEVRGGVTSDGERMLVVHSPNR